jgi:hypothetical protein
VTQTIFGGQLDCYWDVNGQWTVYTYYWTSSIRDQNGANAFAIDFAECGNYRACGTVNKLIGVASVGSNAVARCVK